MTLTSALPTSRWISFLRRYGPIPQNGNAFDEDIQRSAQRHGVEPVRLPTPALNELVRSLTAPTPTSVIVTGTAGDGKTYLCREVWQHLGGNDEDWGRPEKVKKLALSNGRELCLIRDLSEFLADDREVWFPQMADDMLNDASPRVYLVAANHGRLIDEWKAAPSTPSVIILRSVIENQLMGAQIDGQHAHVVTLDLSQQSSAAVFADLLDAMLSHVGWEECAHCPLRVSHDSGNVCPIFENRKRLIGEADGGVLKARLGDLLELSERNGIHFPIRQLLLLTANAILGHPEAEHGLMTCHDVPMILADGSVESASVYRNVFGENVSARRRQTTAVFDALGRFGIGNETSNRIDALLVYGADDPELRSLYERLVLSDVIYGGSLPFLAQQRAYLESAEPIERTSFLSMLRSQRQRLFFTTPSDDADGLGLWELTVFRYAGKYLEVVHRVTAGHAAPQNVISALVRGLNRVFTGILVTNQDQLILATSGSYAQAKTSRLLEDHVSVAARMGEWVGLRAEQTGQGNRDVTLAVSLGNVEGVGPIRLPLTLLRYEFLCRVSDGALPSSFSLECYEDFLAFKAKILEAVQHRRRLTDESLGNLDTMVLSFLRVGSDGRANAELVEVRLA